MNMITTHVNAIAEVSVYLQMVSVENA